jgi:uncharacterized protein
MTHMISMQNRETPLAVFLLPVLLCAALLSSCGTKTAPPRTTEIDSSDVYTLEVLKDRKVKDLDFLKSTASPIPESDRAAFRGLTYFAPDKSFAFECVLARLPAPERVTMGTSKNRPRRMWHIGALSFRYNGQPCTLQVYTSVDTADGGDWFIPFIDATNDAETYGGGRFLDIARPSSDTVMLDFNYAYNPYCAYSHRYDCPIPPMGNVLPIFVRAGERAYHRPGR